MSTESLYVVVEHRPGRAEPYAVIDITYTEQDAAQRGADEEQRAVGDLPFTYRVAELRFVATEEC